MDNTNNLVDISVDSTIDYSNYSLEQLLAIRADINTQDFPKRTKQLDALIAEQQQQAAQAEVPDEAFSDIKFHGTTRDYFSIWIVNLLLSIVTLGVYSAWAKVRTSRYFYANLEVDGHRLSYLGEPLQILKGRAIGVLLFGSYFLASVFSPMAALAVAAILFILAPALLVQGFKFKMKMTGYRNIRFGFTGSYGKALLVFVVFPVMSVFTLYLAFPWAMKKIDQFIYEHLSYGGQKVETDLSSFFYYLASIGAVLIVAVIFGGASIVGLVSTSTMDSLSIDLASLSLAAFYLLAMATASSFYTAMIRNHVFGNSKMSGVAEFRSNIEFLPLAGLRLTNLAAIILTLGFAYPWAKIRTAQFMAAGTRVAILPGADNVIADASNNANAVGDEVSSMFDIDVSLG